MLIIAQEKTEINNNFIDGGFVMSAANMKIRERAKQSGVRLWEIAEQIGINDGNFSRKLRRELSVEEKDNILAIIDRLAQEKQEAV